VNVWTYWEGPRLPYIDLCLESMARVCAAPGVEFRVVTPENLREFVNPTMIHSAYRRLPGPALRADCVRAALLAARGGWWWDADSLGLHPAAGLLIRYGNPQVAYMTWTKPPRRVINGYLYVAPGCGLAAEWLARINAMLRRRDRRCRIWGQLGEVILNELVSDRPGYVEIDRRLFLPVDIDSSVSDFFERMDFRPYLLPETVLFGLNHSWFVHHRRADVTLPPAEWGESPLLVHRLLHHVRTEMLG
jgi:hypothetical protein